MTRLGALMVVGVCLGSVSAHAEESAGKFLDDYSSADLAIRRQYESFLALNENGMGWSNAELSARHQPMLYCQPGSLALTGGQLADMLAREVEKAPYLRAEPCGEVILLTLIDTFPCPAK